MSTGEVGATTAPDARGGFRGASGVGRVLVVVYAVLAMAATGRSVVQILTRFDEAPLAYALSAVAAVVYLIATAALIAKGRVAHIIAAVAIGFEFAGVVVVGAISVLQPELFPADTVWSAFGRGYIFIPLVLPVAGIAWLETQRSIARKHDVRHQ